MATHNENSKSVTVLDPNGDIVLHIKGPRFKDFLLNVEGPDFSDRLRCSSQALKLSSAVFNRMLSPGFQEGDRLEARRLAGESQPLTITLNEDFPEAMVTLVRFLHHASLDKLAACSSQESAAVAVQADKYACQSLLHFWVQSQFSKVLAIKIPMQEDLICLLVLVVICQTPHGHGAGISFLYWHIKPDVVASIKTSVWFCHVDEAVLTLICDEAQVKRSRLQTSVYSIQTRLRSSPASYLDLMDLWSQLLYDDPNITMPNTSRTSCNTETRNTMFFEALESAGLWPDATAFHKSYMCHLQGQLKIARSACAHKCQEKCPLKDGLDKVIQEAQSFA